jgi:ATP-binding cassette subfamily B protein
MDRYFRLLRYTVRQWPMLLLIAGISLAAAATVTLQPWPMKLLVDYALGSAGVPGWTHSLLASLSLPATAAAVIAVAAVASFLLWALNNALDVSASWAWTIAGQRLVYDLAADLFHRLQRLSLLFHTRRTVGDSLSRLTGDTWSIYTVSSSLLIAPMQHLATLVTIGIVAWKLNPDLAMLSLGMGPALGASALFFGNRLKRRSKLSRETQAGVLSFVHQTLTALPIVQAFDTREQNTLRFQGLASDAVTRSQRTVLLTSLSGVVNGLITTAGTATILYFGGLKVLAGTLSLGSLLVFLAYLRSLQTASEGLLAVYTTFKTTSASIDRVFEVLDSEEMVREQPGAPVLPMVRGHVQLEALTVGYEPGRPVLHDVSLEAQPGETIALVGPTGAGKSTLVSLIPRFFDPWSGRVLIDGHDVRGVQLKSLRAQIALVLQEPFLLPLSVAENIAYGRPGATREEIEQAAVAANAHEFIVRMPDGYDTVLGERGATLSGGERQRLSIARALLKDAPILILDEPTSALDSETESLLLEALERLMSGRTTFIIAHRLSTIRRADRIVVIEDGRAVEQGTHGDLIAAGGTYQRFHDLQYGLPAGALR